MMNSRLGDLDAAENYFDYGNSSGLYEYEEEIKRYNLSLRIFQAIILITCSFGLVGNGYIIWLLSFQIKRNGFMTFILNLAVADFGYLASIVLHILAAIAEFQGCQILFLVCISVIHVMHITSNFLLTAISIDRCVAVLFPIWHRCSRPKHLSSVVCVLLWTSSSLLSGIMSIMNLSGNYIPIDFHFLVPAIVCLPLITVSTLILFIKVCLKSNQRNQGRLLLMILITLLCFLILASPLSVLAVINTFSDSVQGPVHYLFMCSIVFSCLNSSINPVIYFLVGRKKGARSTESMKVILQNVFKEGEATGGR